MGKRPRRIRDRSWLGTIKRNPLKWATAVIGLLVSVGALVQQWDNITLVLDHIRWATVSYAREIVREANAPLIAKESTLAVGLDYLILKDQRSALKDAKAELTKNPDSATAPGMIEQLEKSIKERQDRLDRETRHSESN